MTSQPPCMTSSTMKSQSSLERSSKIQNPSSATKINAAELKAANNHLKVAKVTPTNKSTKSAEAFLATGLQRHSGSLISTTASADVLHNFTVFPKLPVELQIKIFKLALPNDTDKVLPLSIIKIAKMAPDTFEHYVLVVEAWAMKTLHASRSPRREDLGLSRACRLSRKVFLEHKTGCLPGWGLHPTL